MCIDTYIPRHFDLSNGFVVERGSLNLRRHSLSIYCGNRTLPDTLILSSVMDLLNIVKYTCCIFKTATVMQSENKPELQARLHYDDVIMGTMASQITSLTIVYSTVYSGADQRKRQSSASLAFGRGNSPGTGEFPAQRASNAEKVSIWWRHHANMHGDVMACSAFRITAPLWGESMGHRWIPPTSDAELKCFLNKLLNGQSSWFETGDLRRHAISVTSLPRYEAHYKVWEYVSYYLVFQYSERCFRLGGFLEGQVHLDSFMPGWW